MTMKITFEHIFCRGLHKVKLVRFNVIEKDLLPLQYVSTENPTQCFTHILLGGTVLYTSGIDCKGNRRTGSYRAGEILSLEERDWILDVMGKAGHKLYEMNKRINKEKRQWEGKVETHKF